MKRLDASPAGLAAGRPWSTAGTALRLSLLAAAYFAVARLGYLFAMPDSVASPVWPPAGLAVAFAALWGWRALPAVFAGAAAVEYAGTQSPWLALAMATGNMAEAALGGWLVRRAGAWLALRTLPGLLRLATAAFVAPLPSATAGASGLVLSGAVPLAAGPTVWWTWYLGDAAGVLIVAPVVLAAAGALAGAANRAGWTAWARSASWRSPRVAEGLGTLAVLLATGAMVFGLVPGLSAGNPALVVLFMPPLVWVAYRLGPGWAATGVLGLDAMAVYVTHQGAGPFLTGSQNASFLVLQAFVLTIAVMALGLAALADERRRAAGELERRVAERTGRLEELNFLLRREVEERKAAQAQAAEAQHIARVGSWTWDVSQPHAVWTEELYRIYGLDPATHTPTYEDYLTRIHPDDVERVKAATEAVFRDHKPYSHDERIRHSDGTWRDLHTWAKAVLDEDGKLTHLVGVCQDITDRVETQTALQESLERFRTLSEAAPIGIVHTLADGTVDYVNGRWRQITGVADHTDAAAMQAAVHPEDQPRMAELWRACVREGREFKGTMRFVHADGAIRWASANALPLRDASGAVTGFVSTLEDITERRAAERKDREVRRLREQAEFKTNFLRTAAHELGTPLTPIRIQMHILRNLLHAPGRADAVEERKAADILARNIQRLQVLVQDMLESARLQSGKLRLSVRPMDLAQVVHEVVETFQEPAIQMGVVLDTDGPRELPMAGDPDRLSQVLYNLLSNAMKFTPAGGRIHVTLAAEPGAHARVTVSDSGAGFTAEQAAQLFQPFMQFHEGGPGRGGSGLGLYISRGIVEQHGGTLTARSPGPGQGAEFSFVVPSDARPPPQPAPEPEPLPQVRDARSPAGTWRAPH